MTFIQFPTPTAEPPQLRLPIAAVTFDGESHHQHPAANDFTLCMLPIGSDATFGSSGLGSWLEPATCSVCAATIEEAVDTLAMPDLSTPERTARVLRSRAGGLLAAAHALHPIEVDE